MAKTCGHAGVMEFNGDVYACDHFVFPEYKLGNIYQKTLVEMHPDGGILNIDILSFERLAYRVFEEVGGDTRRIMEETCKNMVLQKLVQMNQKDLVYLRNQMKKPGYLDEVKSLISEFMQYEIKEEELDEMIRESEDKTLLQMKLQDVKVLYQAFREYLSGQDLHQYSLKSCGNFWLSVREFP